MKFCFIGMIALLLRIDGYAQKQFFSFDGHIQSITISNIRKFEYFTFDNSKQENFTFRFGKNTFVFLPGSRFFALIDKFGMEREFQMQLPTLLVGGKLQIPFRSFLDCLSNSGFFEYSFSSKSYAFRFKEVKKEEQNLGKIQEINKTPQKENTEPKVDKVGKVENNFYQSEKSSIPKLVFTNYERFSIVPPKSKQRVKQEPKINSIPPKENEKDTTGKIPPKFYVLPPELKSNPK